MLCIDDQTAFGPVGGPLLIRDGVFVKEKYKNVAYNLRPVNLRPNISLESEILHKYMHNNG